MGGAVFRFLRERVDSIKEKKASPGAPQAILPRGPWVTEVFHTWSSAGKEKGNNMAESYKGKVFLAIGIRKGG